jgi:hypothetical protein
VSLHWQPGATWGSEFAEPVETPIYLILPAMRGGYLYGGNKEAAVLYCGNFYYVYDTKEDAKAAAEKDYEERKKCGTA